MPRPLEPERHRASASLRSQLSWFLMSGGLSTLVHWTVMGLLIRQGMQSVLATTIGAVTGAILNYLLQFYGTFRGASLHARAAPVYIFTVLLAWLVNAGIFYFLITIAQFTVIPAQICTTAAVAVMNFVLYKRIVFHEASTHKSTP